MRLALLITSAFVLTVCLAAANEPLSGRWRALEMGADGMGEIYEFQSAKDVEYGPANILDGTFKLAGTDGIVLQSSKDAPEATLELEWDGRDQIRIENEAAGQIIKLTRIGDIKDSGNPLLGEWVTVDDAKSKKLPSLSLFYADGQNLWIIPQSLQHGHYSIQGNRIRIEVPNRPVLEGAFTVDGKHLKLPNSKGGQSNFERY